MSGITNALNNVFPASEAVTAAYPTLDSVPSVNDSRTYYVSDSAVNMLVDGVRVARERRARRQRIVRRWALLVVLAVLVALVGFVFGRGLLDVASLLSLGTMLPVGTIADWGKGSVDSAGFAHPLEYRLSRPSAVRPVRPLLELCTCWGCMGNEDCWVYQN